MGTELFQIGSTQVTVGFLATVIGVVAAILIFGRLAEWATRRRFEKLDGDQAEESRAFGTAAKLLIWFVGLVLLLELLDIRMGKVLAAGGLIALAFGFAAKNLLENLLSGSILRLEGTMQAGDMIIVDGDWLVVRRIALR